MKGIFEKVKEHAGDIDFAVQPVTAVCVGIFLFGEAFTTSIGVGIALIIAAVIVIILKR